MRTLVVLFVCLLAGCAPVFAQTVDLGNVFQGQGFGYLIRYPSDWIYQNPSPYTVVFSGAAGDGRVLLDRHPSEPGVDRARRELRERGRRGERVQVRARERLGRDPHLRLDALDVDPARRTEARGKGLHGRVHSAGDLTTRPGRSSSRIRTGTSSARSPTPPRRRSSRRTSRSPRRCSSRGPSSRAGRPAARLRRPPRGRRGPPLGPRRHQASASSSRRAATSTSSRAPRRSSASESRTSEPTP